ncbi:MAG: bifunctional riboflavin kinase/FAD synthetase [Sphingobacteriaceae bacterium]
MRTYSDIQTFSPIKNAVVTIGTFDGVHIGHQKIISSLRKSAKELGGETVILTFFPHPRMILHPEDQELKLITTIKEKAQLLEASGIDHLIITPFTRDFSNLSPEDYIKQILVDKIGTRKIIIGYDHRFGKNREGGIEQLQKFAPIYGFEVEVIPEQDMHQVAVSSSKIRQALLSGDVQTAHEFMGHPFSLHGKVIKGDQIGRKMGYPTANLFIEENYKLIPSDGIYAVKLEIKNKPYQGMAYIGHRPTINGMSRNIEVNIFDFEEDIYGETIRMDFLHYIREDQKFNSLAELSHQLSLDKIAALRLL